MAATLFVVGIAVCSACAGNSGNGIAVATDKHEYQQGEGIRIVFTNNSPESVFSHIRSLTPAFSIQHIEKKNTIEQWEKLYVQCQYPHCTYEIDAPGEIKAGESAALEWEPLVFVNGTPQTVLPEPGVYRLAISYEDNLKKKWLTAYTNIFSINSGRGE
ncbi:MAG: hypothetical protein SCH71_05500 [Desulfobulbaceae bacterium]|nr:hypothetical protein [Desulfobulbaceae bacterium]